MHRFALILFDSLLAWLIWTVNLKAFDEFYDFFVLYVNDPKNNSTGKYIYIKQKIQIRRKFEERFFPSDNKKKLIELLEFV